MNFQKALDLVESILKAKTGKQLTDPEKQILKAAWENQTYNNISDSLYLSIGHSEEGRRQRAEGCNTVWASDPN